MLGNDERSGPTNTTTPRARSNPWPFKKKKKKKLTLVRKLREQQKRQFSRNPKSVTRNRTPEEVQKALRIFEQLRLQTENAGRADQALRKMRESHPNLFLYREGKEGPVPGVELGMKVRFRAELVVLGIHRQLQKGIDWKEKTREDESKELVAFSVVLSGEYEDDEDAGDTVIFTGEGGRDPISKRQIEHQELKQGNDALRNASIRKNSIRVIRRRYDTNSVKGECYTYDGLYKVEKCQGVIGKSGFRVYKFTLAREPNQKPLEWPLQVRKPFKGRAKRAREGRVEVEEEDSESTGWQGEEEDNTSVSEGEKAGDFVAHEEGEESRGLGEGDGSDFGGGLHQEARQEDGHDVSRTQEGNDDEDPQEDSEYEVETILDRRRKKRHTEYLIHWKGYDLDEATWERESNLTHCPDKLTEFESKLVNTPVRRFQVRNQDSRRA